MFGDKRSSAIILLTGFILICFWGMFHQEAEDLEKEDLIRFHVVANSDSCEDQTLKLKVRDEVLTEVSPCLIKMDSAYESRSWLEENREQIKDIAEEVIRKEGYEYPVRAEIGTRWIPEKYYGSLVFPAGNYEAFTLEIGEGAGENWWCVMFPPICMIGEASESEEELKERFKGTKYEDLIFGGAEDMPYVLKFKSAELGKSFMERIKS